MVADVPVGVFLSSGLDSTTIAALAAEQGGNLRTVTLGFEEYKGKNADETPLAEEFAKRCGANHQTIWVSRLISKLSGITSLSRWTARPSTALILFS